MTAIDFMQHVLTMVVAAVAAVFGTHLINTLRREAFEAKQLGQYRLIAPLGAGGMGEVYLAEHRMLKRPCAVKLIRPEQAGDPQRAGPLRARGPDDRPAVALEHRRDLRLRPHRGRHLLLRDGVPARPEPGGPAASATARCRPSASSTCCGRPARPCARPTPSA